MILFPCYLARSAKGDGMAVEDYKKKKSKLATLRKGYDSALNTREKQLADLEKSSKFLADAIKDMKYALKLDQRYLHTSCEKWEAMVVEIMYVQEDLKEAVMAKDKAGVKEQEKKMKALVAKEKPEEKMFDQLFTSLLAHVTRGDKLNK
jgi:hypothetical protein